MRRRDFIKGFVGSAVAWPLAAHGQPVERVRSIGILLGVAVDDPQGKAIISALSQGLRDFGWIDGRNAKIYYRGASKPDDLAKHATELATLVPDVMVATGGTSAGPLLRASKTIPIAAEI